MDTSLLRNEIHKYIDQADERFLNLVYGMIKADKEDVYMDEISPDEIQLIEERLADYYKNPNRGSDWEEVKKGIMK